MSVYDVGTENLPNIYIEKVTISDDKRSMVVQTYLKDHLYHPTWTGSNSILNNLRIKYLVVIGSPDSEIIEALNSGTASIMEFNAPLSEGKYISVVDSDILLLESEKKLGLNVYRNTTHIELPPGVSSATLYACCYYDFLEEITNDFFKHFAGPVASERILSAGLPHINSGYFYFPDTNEAYGGPVHYHEEQGVHMQGSSHSESPHSKLNFVKSKNTKVRIGNTLLKLPDIDWEAVQDLNMFFVSQTNMIDIKPYSMSSDSSVLSLLHINLSAILYGSTPRAIALKLLNPAEYKNLTAEHFQLTSLSLFRRRFGPLYHEIPDSTLLLIDVPIVGKVLPRSFCYDFNMGTVNQSRKSFTKDSVIQSNRPSNYSTNNFVQEEIYSSDLDSDQSKKISEVYEVPFKQNINIRTLLVEDSLEGMTPGTNLSNVLRISYRAGITYRQTLDNYILSIYHDLTESTIFLESLISDCSISQNYNTNLNEFSEDYKVRIAEDNGINYNRNTKEVYLNSFLSGLSNYKDSQSDYIKFIGALTSAYRLLAPVDGLDLVQTLVDHLLPFSTQVEILSLLMTDLLHIMASLETIYDIRPNNFSNQMSMAADADRQSTSFIVDMQDIFTARRTDLGYKIFSPSRVTKNNFTKKDLRGRLSYEEKYFSNLKNNSDVSNLDPEMKPHFTFSTMNKKNYLTPLSIKIEDSSISLTKGFTDINSRELMFFRLRSMGFISDTSPDNSSGENAFSGEMVATDGSTLSVASENLDEEEDGLVLSPAWSIGVPNANGGVSTYTIPEIKLGDDDDYWFPPNETAVLYTNSLFGMPTIEKWWEDYAPHHKAMMFENWGISGHDFFADHRFRRIIAETAMNVFKLRCITGFEVSSTNGLEILSSLVETDLTEDLLNSKQPFFCYTIPHQPMEDWGYFKCTQVDSMRPERAEILNNLLYVIGQVEMPGSGNNIGNQTIKYNYRDRKEYYKSNIIKQDRSKSGILSLLPSFELDLSNVMEFYKTPENVITIEDGVPVYGSSPPQETKDIQQELARMRTSIRPFTLPSVTSQGFQPSRQQDTNTATISASPESTSTTTGPSAAPTSRGTAGSNSTGGY